MASDELSSKLSRRLQIEEGAADPVALEGPNNQNGSEEKSSTANADSELGAKLMRREALNEGEICPRNAKVFSPYSEFKEFSRSQIKDMERMFKTWVCFTYWTRIDQAKPLIAASILKVERDNVVTGKIAVRSQYLELWYVMIQLTLYLNE